MKVQGFIIVALFLNVFGNGYSKATPGRKNNEVESLERVYGGYLIPRDSEYKQGFTVLIEYYDDITAADPSYICTGSIVSADYIVSTAYCLGKQSSSVYAFDISITGLKGTRFHTAITAITLHENYDESTLENNIALGKVNDPYDFFIEELFPVQLPETTWGEDQFTGKHLTVCGHRNPYTTENYYDYEPTCFIFTPRTRDYCTVQNNLALEDNEICASSSNMEKYSVCEPDFGAGLISRDDAGNFYLYAIASYTDPYGCAEGPTAFLLVNGFVEWLQLNMV